MCADQPAVRAQVNIAVNMCAGTWAKSRTTAAQYSTLVASTRSGLRTCSSARAASSSATATSYRGAPSSLAVRRSTRARGSSARYTRWPNPISRSPLSSSARTYLVASPIRSTSSTMCSTRAGAPPCSGPDMAPTAPDSAAATSARGGSDDPGGEGGSVHAVLSSRGPVGINGLDVPWIGVTAPADHEPLNDVARLIHPFLRNRGQAGAPRGLGHERQRHDRGAGQVVACLFVADVQQRPHPLDRRQHRQGALHVHPDIAGADGDRVRLGGR